MTESCLVGVVVVRTGPVICFGHGRRIGLVRLWKVVVFLVSSADTLIHNLDGMRRAVGSKRHKGVMMTVMMTGIEWEGGVMARGYFIPFYLTSEIHRYFEDVSINIKPSLVNRTYQKWNSREHNS
jgi:hypothetical protein